MKVKGSELVEKTEAALQEAVANVGPISVGINVLR